MSADGPASGKHVLGEGIVCAPLVIEVAYPIKRHLHGALNYSSAARITNVAAEGINPKLPTIKMAYGFRSRAHFKTTIFFHCGGLQLYPATHGEAG
ncbi:MAG: transposase [Acidimicrobiales bacterium]